MFVINGGGSALEDLRASAADLDNLRFVRPTFIGDTIHSVREITQLMPKDERYGVASAKLEVRNQRDETLLVCDFRILVHRLPAGEASQILQGARG